MVAPHDAGLRRYVVRHDPIAAFAGALILRVGDDVVGLRRKADHELRPLRFARRDRREDVGVLDQAELRAAVALLDFLFRFFGAPIGHRRREYCDIGRERLFDRGKHLARGRYLHGLHARRIRQVDRSGHQDHLGACGRGGACDGVALLPGRAVGEIAHRIDRLVGRPGGDDHAFAGERLGARAAQQLLDRIRDLQRLGHAADPALAALGHVALIGTDHCDAVGSELREVAARRRVFPHARVHGRRDQHLFVGREQHGRGEIVGVAARHLGHEVRGGRRHDDKVGLAREADVADVELAPRVEQIGERTLAGERAGGERRDELLRGPGQNAAHRGAALLEPPDQVERLVGGNAAADDQKNALAVEHRRHSIPLVPRTRSSHHDCRESDCELRVQSGTRIIRMLVSFDSEVRFGRAANSGELRNRDTSLTIPK